MFNLFRRLNLLSVFGIRASHGMELAVVTAASYNTGQVLRSLRSLGLCHIFASAIATAKTSPAPETLYEMAKII